MIQNFDQKRELGEYIANQLIKALRSTDFLPKVYPSLFDGLAEGSLHSFMLSALIILGDRLGYSAICDSPVFDHLDNILLEEGNKRPDSIWFERGTEKIRVLIEFERYANNSLEKKARNLVTMANSCQEDIGLLVLMYWTHEVHPDNDLENASNVFKNGFTYKASLFGPIPCPSIVIETKVKKSQSKVSIDGYILRKFIFEGENKFQITNNLNK